MTNPIAIARRQEIFAVKETTRGTLEKPTAGSYVIGAGFATLNQQPSYTESEEVVDTRDIIDRFQDRFEPGDWEIPMYARPSGALGVAPMASDLYECLMGVKTVNAGVSVVYSQAITKPSFSLWQKKDHTVFWARGCSVGKAEVTLETTGAVKLMLSGQCMERGWTGTDTLNGGEPISETAIVVTDAKKYKAGGYVEFVSSGTTYDNSGAGYAVSSVNYTTGTVTITPGLEVALNDGDTIKPWLPTGTVVGDPVESRACKAVVNAVDTPVLGMNYSIEDQPEYLVDEITLTDYPESYVETKRNITGSLDLYMRQDDIHYFYDGENNNTLPLKMVTGDTAGSIMEIATPQTSINAPEIEDVDPTISIKMEFFALGTSAGEDSATITFK